MSLTPGRRIAIDVGTVRVGVARTDERAITITPLPAVSPDAILPLMDSWKNDEDISVIYVGLPKQLSGEEGTSAENARLFARKIAARYSIPVRLVDERLTTKSAIEFSRKNRESAGFDLDSLAAAAILEFALSGERNLGRFFGEVP